MAHEVRRLSAVDEAAFRDLHARADGGAWCHCVAWWVATWEGWGERSGEENAALRRTLFERGEHDGYLLFEGGRALAWVQAGPRDRLEKLVREQELAPEPRVWALTCFFVDPRARGQGHARRLLAGVLEDLRARGVPSVEAYPRNASGLAAGELWNGPLSLLEAFGFEALRTGGRRARYRLELT